jgi:hypothetical protein
MCPLVTTPESPRANRAAIRPALNADALALVTHLWSCATPVTRRQLVLRTGMDHQRLDDCLASLKSCGLLRTLNTVIESYVASGPPPTAA